MKNVTITLSDEQMAKLNSIATTREGKTLPELAMQVVDRGLYDIAYRSKRNKQQWAQYKEWKQSQADNS